MKYKIEIMEIARIACEQLKSDYICGQMDISDDFFDEIRDEIDHWSCGKATPEALTESVLEDISNDLSDEE